MEMETDVLRRAARHHANYLLVATPSSLLHHVRCLRYNNIVPCVVRALTCFIERQFPRAANVRSVVSTGQGRSLVSTASLLRKTTRAFTSTLTWSSLNPTAPDNWSYAVQHEPRCPYDAKGRGPPNKQPSKKGAKRFQDAKDDWLLCIADRKIYVNATRDDEPGLAANRGVEVLPNEQDLLNRGTTTLSKDQTRLAKTEGDAWTAVE